MRVFVGCRSLQTLCNYSSVACLIRRATAGAPAPVFADAGVELTRVEEQAWEPAASWERVQAQVSGRVAVPAWALVGAQAPALSRAWAASEASAEKPALPVLAAVWGASRVLRLVCSALAWAVESGAPEWVLAVSEDSAAALAGFQVSLAVAGQALSDC
jgi:hypothetical protein